MRPNPYIDYTDALAAIPSDRRRALKPASAAIKYNFSSNDYLGLSQHPAVRAAAIAATQNAGAGAGAARLITGNHEYFEETEAALALLKKTEAALLFGSGYLANATALPALLSTGTWQVLVDRLAHRSLLDGVMNSGAAWSRFRHNDMNHLSDKAESAVAAGYRPFIVVESVYGMDGDTADAAALFEIKQRTGALIYADEAHATGVLGIGGAGLLSGVADIILGTCGKALGNFGAFIAAKRVVVDYLIQFCPGFIYATGLPPGVVAGTEAAVRLLPEMESARASLLQRADTVRIKAQAAGFQAGNSTTHIIPLLCGSDARALKLAAHLTAHGCTATAIRPPTVPEGSARVRLSLSTTLTDAAYTALFDGLERCDF
ncbi:MAG: aminotransferase class I/II-fold pyridoxal phosphate-dependent enzyme [Alphaproteobacteria bacterium]|nr:aminotransferase class I/II-fold pyridoxal phosphate-dependent enzyme [Alphaproteobacteria bacterium]